MVLIAVLKLIGYQYNWERGVDTYLFYFKLGVSRMSPNAAFSFLLIGLALVLMDVQVRGRAYLSQICVIAATVIGLLSMSSYFHNVLLLYGVSGFVPVVPDTATEFLILCFGLLCARPHREPVATIISTTEGGSVARHLLPAALCHSPPTRLGAHSGREPLWLRVWLLTLYTAQHLGLRPADMVERRVAFASRCKKGGARKNSYKSNTA